MPGKFHTIFNFFLLSILVASLLPLETASAANSNSALIASRLDIVGAKIHVHAPVAIADLPTLEPVCELILRYQKRWEDNPSLGIWYIQLKDSPLLDLPQNNIAKGVDSFHHYCWGEVVRNRYFSETDPRKRKELAEYAMSGSKYIIDHPQFRPQNWPYLSHVYVTMGTGYLLMKDNVSAINAFLMALQLNPRERTAYIHLADTLLHIGKKPEALKQVTEGLKYFPKNKGLIRRYQELGGKLPYPEPYVGLSLEIKEDDGTATTTNPPESNNEKTTPNSEAASTSNATPQAPEKATPNPDNPYCRFCP